MSPCWMQVGYNQSRTPPRPIQNDYLVKLHISYKMPSVITQDSGWYNVQLHHCHQAPIHTDFHHFSEIGQIFHNKYIFNKKKTLSKLKSGKWIGIRHAVRFQLENQPYCVYPVWMTQKPRKGDYRVLKSNKILGEACPQMVACVASVSNRVIERKVERKQKKVEGGGGGEKRVSHPLPHHSFFFLLLSQLSRRTSRGNACYAGYQMEPPESLCLWHSF